MGKFAEAYAQTRGSFVGSTLKKLIASHAIPFTVTAMSGKVWNANFRTDEWNLQISFTDAQIADYPELQKEMTLTFTSVPKASREDMLIVLKEELDEEGPTQAVLTYDANVGRNGWYDIKPA